MVYINKTEVKIMKKTKLLVLTAMTALALAGCNNKAKEGELPSGGKTVDVTTEAGKATLKDRLNAVSKAYEENSFDSASLTGTLSGVNLNATANAEMGDEETSYNINLEAEIKDFGAKAEVKAAKHAKGAGEQYDSVDGSASIKTTGGTVSLKGTLPGSEQGKTASIDSSLSLKDGLDAKAYLSGSKLYLDISAESNNKLVKNTNTFANTLLGQLKESMFGSFIALLPSAGLPEGLFDAEKLEFTLDEFYANNVKDKKVFLDMGAPVEWPAFKAEESQEDTSSIDEAINAITELANMNIGFEFKTYSGNAFGFAFSMNKDSIKNIIRNTTKDEQEATALVGQVDKLLSKFTLDADVYFNKKALLESAGISFNVGANLDKDILGDYSAMFKSFSANIEASAKAKVELKYGGVKVSFPSFADFKELKLSGDKQ